MGMDIPSNFFVLDRPQFLPARRFSRERSPPTSRKLKTTQPSPEEPTENSSIEETEPVPWRYR
jgi:hypothetical protein